MTRVVLTEPARCDRLDVWLHIAADNPAAADHLLDEIDEKLKLLAYAPQIGRARDHIFPNLRQFPVGNYLILYTVEPGEITIVRILHGARYLAALL
jgi:toxin ParE1/3/4